MTGLIAARHLEQFDANKPFAVDLGCSLGATVQAILAQTDVADVTVLGVDNSAAMIERAQAVNNDSRATYVEGDLLAAETLERCRGAGVITLNFVLQFIDPEQRGETLAELRQALAPGGMLILSEKVKDLDASRHEYFDATHLAWKRANGYSELEVSQKRSALENVMRVDDETTHIQRLQDAGFDHVMQWYKCMNWASFIAWV